jgi:hypothetical protein
MKMCGPDQPPEDGWTTLGASCWNRAPAAALRAFYLGSLAHLAPRQLTATVQNHRDQNGAARQAATFPESLSGLVRMSGLRPDRYAHEISAILSSGFLPRSNNPGVVL